MDDQQRARELLATELERAGGWVAEDADEIRRGVLGTYDRAAVAAITAALRAAPEGFVVMPTELTDEMVRAVYPLHWFLLGSELREHYSKFVASRPQEASDA